MEAELTETSPAGSYLATTALAGSLLLSFTLVGGLVVSRSNAAFSATTEAPASSVTAGTVSLSDDDSDSAMFEVAAMVPGDVSTECIEVTYDGTIADPGPVRLYSGGYTDSDDLASYLNLTIEEGTGGSFGDCSGFSSAATIETGGTLADFGTAHTNYATGAGTWDPSSTPVSRSYRVTLELDSSVPDSQQGDSVTGLTLTWEIQS